MNVASIRRPCQSEAGERSDRAPLAQLGYQAKGAPRGPDHETRAEHVILDRRAQPQEVKVGPVVQLGATYRGGDHTLSAPMGAVNLDSGSGPPTGGLPPAVRRPPPHAGKGATTPSFGTATVRPRSPWGGSGGENIFPRRRKFCLLYTKSVHVVYKPHPSPRTHKRRVVLFLRRNNFA